VRNTANWNLQAHGGSYKTPAGLGVVVDPPDGSIPYRAEALAIKEKNWASRDTADPLEKCYLAGAPRTQEDALAEYGMHLGTAFQLVDDILDYSGDRAQTGKNLGDDLSEGKATLPLIRAMRNGGAEQSALIRKAIVEGGLSDFGPVMQAMEQTGAIEYTRRQAEDSAQRARAAIAGLAHSKYKDCLLELAAFAVTRNY